MTLRPCEIINIMKAIVLGPPLSGKSTLCRYLRESTDLQVLDYDEELLRLNDGKWPGDDDDLNSRLKNEVERSILTRDDTIFFAFEFNPDNLTHAKDVGYKIFQLCIAKEELAKRNLERLKSDPSNDAFQYIDTNLKLQEYLYDRGLIDKRLDASQLPNVLAKEILNYA